jgi:Transposase DDE domain
MCAVYFSLASPSHFNEPTRRFGKPEAQTPPKIVNRFRKLTPPTSNFSKSYSANRRRDPCRFTRDVAREIAKTDAYVRSRQEQKKIEMLFAHLKRILRLDRLRLRGPLGARDEFLLAATAQNLARKDDPAAHAPAA